MIFRVVVCQGGGVLRVVYGLLVPDGHHAPFNGVTEGAAAHEAAAFLQLVDQYLRSDAAHRLVHHLRTTAGH